MTMDTLILAVLLVIPLLLMTLGIFAFMQLKMLRGNILWVSQQLDAAALKQDELLKKNDDLAQLLRMEMAAGREESQAASRSDREELGGSIKAFETAVSTQMSAQAALQQQQWDSFALQLKSMSDLQSQQLESFARQIKDSRQGSEEKLEQMRQTLEHRVKELQEDNGKKLEQMRQVVDEKLHATLEQRLGESFKLVSERLDLVHKGLGEMQSLAEGVGDLKKVLGNVKSRGTWGEVQLGNILEDMLSPEQYGSNVAVRQGRERVEYAIRLPGPDETQGQLWLPIDAKFPVEDYQRLLEAYEQADAAMAEQYGKQLELRIRGEAKNIGEKYIEPPLTTDFAIMFLPTEGLYAEVLRRPGLSEALRRDYKVVVAGPTTLAAMVSSFSMGFRTLAIQQRSGEVWQVLGAVKTEFSRFGNSLEKVQKKLQEASNSIDAAATRSRAVERKLKKVEALPAAEALTLLDNEDDGGKAEEEMEI
ncbi:MAG: DNA recombination protein RmuC [Syntrophomonadaceae bacterium]|nr:DNA recombination protein RmuC [Syntrophomonadaceae bacterium]